MEQKQSNSQDPPFWKKYTDFTSYAKMLEEQAARFPDRVYLRYQETVPEKNNNISSEYKAITYSQVDQITEYLANEWDMMLPMDIECVAFLSDNPMQNILAMFSVFKLGIPFFPLSTRNSETANIHLLKEAKAGYLIASEKYSKMAKTCATKIVSSFLMEEVDGNEKRNSNSTIGIKIWDNFNVHQLLTKSNDTEATLSMATEAVAKELFTQETVVEDGVEREEKRENNDDRPSKRQCTRKRRRTYSDNPEDIALIIHSSGTTSLPKPIRESTRFQAFAQFQLLIKHMERYGPDFAIKPTDVMLLPVPSFHLLFTGVLFTITMGGSSAIIFNQLPPLPKDLLALAKKYGATMLTTTPIILEYMEEFLNSIQDEDEAKEYTQLLKQFKFCIYSGASLLKSVGNSLYSKGLNIICIYGSSEIGIFGVGNPTKENKHWYCFELNDNLRPYLDFEPYDNDIYHVVLHGDCPSLATGVSNRPNGAFATNDLFTEDPFGSGHWRVVGRMDDTLVMKNGEKTNAAAMEQDICDEPLVKNCAVIGADKECTAVLIELNKNTALDYSPTQLTSKVYDAIRNANTHAPSHSTIIIPQMVYMLPLSQQLPTTPKGTVQRKKAIEQFKIEIESLYDNFLHGQSKGKAMANTSQNHNKDESSSDTRTDLKLFKNDKDFLLNAAAQVLHHQPNEIEANVSLFDYGLDSLRAIQLRNIIMTRFEFISSSFLYEHPTLESMIDVLSAPKITNDTINDNNDGDTDQLVEYQEQQRQKQYQQTQSILQDYLERAKNDFPYQNVNNVTTNSQQQENVNEEHTILLTGSTGGLGAHLLHNMIQSPRVKRIYCMVRGKKDVLIDRIKKSFEERCMDPSILLSDKVKALPMDLSTPQLGLDDIHMYEKLKKEITMIQCCGWLVNFNQPVENFERECIRGLYNLLKFSYRETNPIHVHFVSSTSATTNYQTIHPSATRVPENPPPKDPHVAMSTGYAQSKYIVERLFTFLAEEKNLPCFIERLGQVCGDTEHGIWNTMEVYPRIIVGGAYKMKLMPDLLEHRADWIPMDYAAKCIFEIMLSTASNVNREKKEQFVYHVVNPKQISWNDILDIIRKCGMEFKVVKPTMWLDELRKKQDNPAYPLLPFYENYCWRSSLVKYRMPVWDTEKSIQVFSSLAQTPAFDQKLFQKGLLHWKKIQFY